MNEKVLAIVIKGRNEASQAFRSASDDIDAVGKRTTQMGALAKTAVVGLAAATVAGIGAAVKSYGDFESSLSQLQQASQASGEEMGQLSNLARALGRDASFAGVTAADAATSMVELSKAGLSVNDTMAASRGVLALAKAGNIDFASSATIAASALNAFQMEGKDATKVADALAAGANASQADLADLALGLQQSATVAKQFNLSLNDNVTALALFANNGIKGSDAGTSLKTMLISLAKPSTAAAGAMKDIGFNAYDASGKFVGLEEMSQRLSKSLSGLTDQQKQETLATIFGTDAFRAAAVMADNAGTSYDNMSRAVGRSGAAQEAAKAQMGTYQRAMESLGNSVSDVALEVGERFAPSVTAAANALSGSLGPALGHITSFLSTFGPALLGIAAGWGAYQLAITAAAVATGAFAAAQGALTAVMAANPVGLLAIALIGVTTAFIASTSATDSNASSSDRLRIAQDNLKISTDALNGAKQSLTQAQLQQEGATLAVERATIAVTQAQNQYGAGSLQAREASHQLRSAQDQLSQANARVSAATSDLSAKQDQNAVSANQLKSAQDNASGSMTGLQAALRNARTEQNSTGVTFDAVTGKVNAQASSVGTLRERLDAINGRTFNYTLSQQLTSSGSGAAPEKRASGGPVRAGQPYIVGDNPDGSLNRTSELFVPNTSGRIISSNDLRDALSGGSKQQAGNTFNIQSVNLGDSSAVDRFFDRTANIGELGNLGVGV